MTLPRPLTLIAAALLAATAALPARAEDPLTLRFHHWSTPTSFETVNLVMALASSIEHNANGTLKVQVFHSMSLGGKPRDLVTQVESGVVDIIYTLPAYHAGAFPITEGLELPFVGSSAEVISQVAWDYVGRHAQQELGAYKLLSISSSDPGIVQTTKKPVRALEDLKGLKIRVAGRYVGLAVESLGATPVQMPLTDVYESLSHGQTQGMMLPWLISVPFKLFDVAKYQVDYAIYNPILIVLMNKSKYASLSPAQKAGIDNSIGRDHAKTYGKLWDAGAENGRKVAKEKGDETILLSEAEKARWREAAKGAQAEWIKDLKGKGIDGTRILDDLKALVAHYEKKS